MAMPKITDAQKAPDVLKDKTYEAAYKRVPLRLRIAAKTHQSGFNRKQRRVRKSVFVQEIEKLDGKRFRATSKDFHKGCFGTSKGNRIRVDIGQLAKSSARMDKKK